MVTGLKNDPVVDRSLPHIQVAGVRIFDGDLEEACAALTLRRAEGRGSRVATANLDFLAQARQDAQLRSDLDASTLVVADGAPVAWLARLGGGRKVSRVAGVDLVARLCAELAEGGGRVVLYGSTLEVAVPAAAALEARYPGVRVGRILCPPFRELSADEEAREREAIRLIDPALVLVALGCPKQEALIGRYLDSAPNAIWIGVGGSFDFLAGRRRRAPRVLQRLGVEWLVRLAQEPSRLWRRYLLRDIPFLLRVAPGHILAGTRLR